MLCRELSKITHISDLCWFGFRAGGLEVGSRMDESLVRPNCQLSVATLTNLRDGKEDYLLNHDQTGVRHGAYVMGWEQERRDFHSMISWANDLQKCLMDRKRGAVQ